jgi:hypothetical protein
MAIIGTVLSWLSAKNHYLQWVSTIFQLYCGDEFYWWKNPDYPLTWIIVGLLFTDSQSFSENYYIDIFSGDFLRCYIFCPNIDDH